MSLLDVKIAEENARVSEQTRLYIKWRDGQVELRKYDDSALAYAVWLGLPKGVRACFRGAGDKRPIYPWDYVDRP